MKRKDIFVSVVLVVDNHVKNLHTKVEKASHILKKEYTNYEIIIIDNGINPEQAKNSKQLLHELACLRLIKLSKSTDIDTAIYAGIDASIGDVIITLYDSDPVSHIPKIASAVHEGYDAIFGVADNLKRPRKIYNAGARLFYWYSKRYLGISIPYKSTYFIALTRQVANALTVGGHQIRHIRHHARMVGFTTTEYRYTLPGEGLYRDESPSHLLTMAVRVISSSSSHPLRIATYLGVVASTLNIVYALYVFIIHFFVNGIQSGWTSLSLELSVMFFILFLILAIISEYIGRLLEQTSQQPPYHVMYDKISSISVADETRRNIVNE